MNAQTISIRPGTGEFILDKPLIALHGTDFVLSCAFLYSGRPAAIPDYTTDTLRLGMKLRSAPDSDTSLIPAGTWEVVGADAATRYVFTGSMLSAALTAALGSELSIEALIQIAWQVDGETDERKTRLIPVTIEASATLPDDLAPDVDDAAAAFTWLNALLTVTGGLVKTATSPSNITLASGRSGERLSSLLTAYSGSWTTVWTISIPANSGCKLDLALVGISLPAGEGMRVRGTLAAGVTASGMWTALETKGDFEVNPATTFTTENKLIDHSSGGGALVQNALPQSFFIINANGSPANITIQIQSTDVAAGHLGAGSFYSLQKF